MNSTIQCLSNSPQLTDYFLQDQHLAELNRTNALGWKGRVAEEYGALIKELWSGKFSTVAPAKFKQVLGEFAPRFSGWEQHDSSELLSFLLDGLHEDLNRVTQKPTTQTVESKGRPDAVVAQEAWETHLKRNRSVIVDLLQGQLKSTVVCPDCPRISITFDPFMFMSVPLPQVADKKQRITFVFRDYRGKGLLEMEPLVTKTARICELKDAVSSVVGVPSAHMVVVELWQDKLYRFYSDDESVADISSRDDILVYEVPELATIKPHKAGLVQLLNINPRGIIFRRDVPIVLAFETDEEVKTSHIRAKVNQTLAGRVKPEVAAQNPAPYDIMLPEGYERYNLMVTDDVTAPLFPRDRYNMMAGMTRANVKIAVRWPDGTYDDQFLMQRRQHESITADHGVDNSGDSLTLRDCFLEFAREEQLGENDAWYCSDCKKHQQAKKKMELYRLPDILIVHLKRFSYSRINRSKITSYVDFPVEGLDLKEWCANKEENHTTYDLYAISNHMGELGGGHYNAFCRNLIDGQWYLLDDSSPARRVDPSRIKSADAYVLFYKRRGTSNVLN